MTGMYVHAVLLQKRLESESFKTHFKIQRFKVIVVKSSEIVLALKKRTLFTERLHANDVSIENNK